MINTLANAQIRIAFIAARFEKTCRLEDRKLIC